MKKKIIGIVAAALLLGSSIGYAANSSLIGAKVTGLFSVEQDGKKIADAVIINGSAYVPVRAMSEATGTGLAVEGKTITVESKATAIAETGTTVAEPVTTRVLTETERETLRSKMVTGERAIAKYREVIAQTESELAAATGATDVQGLKDFIADLESRIAATETIIADIKAQLGE